MTAASVMAVMDAYAVTTVWPQHEGKNAGKAPDLIHVPYHTSIKACNSQDCLLEVICKHTHFTLCSCALCSACATLSMLF